MLAFVIEAGSFAGVAEMAGRSEFQLGWPTYACVLLDQG
jgi:hypothetical protein